MVDGPVHSLCTLSKGLRWLVCDAVDATSRDLDPRPILKVKVEGTDLDTLIDSGAGVTVMSNSVYKKLNLKSRLRDCNAQIASATGDRLYVCGVATLKIQLGDFSCERPVVIVEGLARPFIIGADTMAAEHILVDPARRKVIYRKLTQEDRRKCRLNKGVTLPPYSETVVMCDVGLQNEKVYFQPSVELDLHGAEASEGCYSVCKGRVPVVISNCQAMEIHLERATVLGTVDVHWTESSWGETIEEVQAVEVSSRKKTHEGKEKKPQACGNVKIECDLSGIPEAWREKYSQLLNKHPRAFSIREGELGLCSTMPQVINLKDPSHVSCRPQYRIPENLRPVVRKYVDKLLSANVIRPSTSPFSSPLMLVRKPHVKEEDKGDITKQYRVVHDYRDLNENIVRQFYNLSRCEELIDRVASCQVYSVLDLKQGYFQQELDEKSRKYTAFGIPGIGHYEYNRSPQGIVNSPACYQRLLDHVLRGISGVYIYVDDVIVASESHVEHLYVLEQVLNRLEKHGLKLGVDKVQLGASTITYLGYEISKTGIKPGQAKTETISTWPEPRNVKEVRQFLGLASFFRRVVKDFSSIAKPLTRLTRKDCEWTRGQLPEDASKAFATLKKILSSRPCMKAPEFDKPFILTCDASTTIGLGAVLSQVDKDGLERPVAYASRTLKDNEQQWAAFHVEALCLSWAMKHFRPYLVGRQFTVRTDHHPLVTLNKTQSNSLSRLRADLAEFDFFVEYIPGEVNPADGLSRLAQVEEIYHPVEVMSKESLIAAQRQDGYVKALAVFVKYKKMPHNCLYMEYVHNVLKQVVPHYSSEGLVTIKLGDTNLVLVPKALIPNVLQQCHSHRMAGHFALAKTLQRVLQNYWWPDVSKDTAEFCKNCNTCQETNPAHSNMPVPLERMDVVLEFGARVHFDLMTTLPAAGALQFKNLLVIKDAYTHWVELIPLPDKEAKTVARALYEEWVCRYGCPDTFVSDQGSEATAKFTQEMCRLLGVRQVFTSTAHPQSNAVAERTMRSVVEYLRKYITSNQEWVELLPSLRFALNSSMHTRLRKTPYIMMFARRVKLPGAIVYSDVNWRKYSGEEIDRQFITLAAACRNIKEDAREIFAEEKKAFDKRARVKKVRVGDRVYVTRPKSGKLAQKFQRPFMGPYVVIRELPHNNIEIQSEKTKRLVRVHINRVKLACFNAQLYDVKDQLVSDDPRASTKNEKLWSQVVSPEATNPADDDELFGDDTDYGEDEDSSGDDEGHVGRGDEGGHARITSDISIPGSLRIGPRASGSDPETAQRPATTGTRPKEYPTLQPPPEFRSEQEPKRGLGRGRPGSGASGLGRGRPGQGTSGSESSGSGSRSSRDLQAEARRILGDPSSVPGQLTRLSARMQGLVLPEAGAPPARPSEYKTYPAKQGRKKK